MELSFFTLFLFISFVMLFHRFCDQTKTQLNGVSSDLSESELVARTVLISYSKIKCMTGHGQPIVHFSFFGKKLTCVFGHNDIY